MAVKRIISRLYALQNMLPVFIAKKRTEERRFAEMDAGTSDMFRIANQMKRPENQDILGDNCVRNDEGNLAVRDDDKKLA